MNKCENCGDVFDSKRGLTVHKNNCLDRDRSKKEYNCTECNSTFKDYPSRREFKNSNNYFCSKECKDSYEKNGKMFKCTNCGNDVYCPRSRLNSMGNYPLDNKFCDKKCESEWKSKNWVGKDHPTYKGWSNENSYGTEWNSIRIDVLERDSYKCQRCGINNKKHKNKYGMSLHIHHKVPLRKFELASDANVIDNLITYCVSCHKKEENN